LNRRQKEPKKLQENNILVFRRFQGYRYEQKFKKIQSETLIPYKFQWW